ncbi:hypothetical protein LEP1GSC016_2071 [Leptospira borgpetersenii serovar Hardjo-bovis str. Sponselee]|uniref:Uncharacterized protein n=1 Tax=Leptospira borgpetersenii serovar Hardjo-bovis str. Sponselee TaxID=1303729 RepID=M6BT03_LEPBO|nr:hypothetical protein LEP1GSC016_2071 [Leptospira borgpetersenii serovar Hardjo-bovis str. Sponselee]
MSFLFDRCPSYLRENGQKFMAAKKDQADNYVGMAVFSEDYCENLTNMSSV